MAKLKEEQHQSLIKVFEDTIPLVPPGPIFRPQVTTTKFTTTRVVNKTRVAIAFGVIILIIGTIIYLKKRKSK